MMLAAVLETVPTDQLVIADDVTLRDVGPGDVKIKVAHSGVCHCLLYTSPSPRD